MKKNIGPVAGLYPTPVTIIGTVVNGTVNWSNIAHVGIIGRDATIMLSIRKGRLTCAGIRENGAASVNLVTEAMIPAADYVGIFSGKQKDKSAVFPYRMGELSGAPIIEASPLVMECELVDIYDTSNNDNFILKVAHTHVDEACLNEEGVPDVHKIGPILFERFSASYLRTGGMAGKCWSAGKDHVT